MRNQTWCDSHHYQVVIDAPELEYLEFIDASSGGFVIEFNNTTSIVKAALELSGKIRCNVSEIWAMASGLWCLCNIKVLRVSSKLVEATLSDEHEHDFDFISLTKLVMSYCAADFNTASNPQKTKRLPNLEVLVLSKLPCSLHTATCEALKQDKSKINCLKYSLTTLELGRFEGNERDMTILEYFMENATMLNEVRISTDLMSKKESEKAILKKLLHFQGALMRLK